MIELLVVIGIMSILMMISVPLFQQFARGQDLADAGRIFQQTIRKARWEAISRRERVRIIFTATALGLYYDSSGYGEDFEPIRLPRGLTYTYNFGDPPGLSPPDEFPRPDEITNSKTGREFEGVVEILRDGSISFRGGFEDIPQPYVDEIRLFDPNRQIARRIPRDVKTDIVFKRRGESKQCYVDIMPNTGRAVFVVLEAEREVAAE
ncbi:MAG: type II secretion system protein [Planctomycetota bacterium]|nr:type II secretion system protein [Planctomycetota bacterium]